MKIVGVCNRNTLCLDCDNPDCLRAGDIEQDCPKYSCDNAVKYDCENCEFMKKYQEHMRAQYQKG